MEDHEVEIISSSTRKEKLINFIKNYLKIIISFVITLILILFGYFFYNDMKKKKRIKISENFNKSITEINNNNEEKIKNNLIEIILQKDKTYSPLSLYFIIENDLIISQSEINKYFDIIINDIGLSKEIKFLNIYKKALYNSNFDNDEYLMKIINPLLVNENAWKSHALYLLGEYYYSKNNNIKAKKYLNDIVVLNNANENIKLEAQKRLQRDLSE